MSTRPRLLPRSQRGKVKKLTLREQRVELQMNKCVYFTGTHEIRCAAGIRYDAVRQRQADDSLQYPCTSRKVNTCPTSKYYTEAEANNLIDNIDLGWERALTALTTILHTTGNRREGVGSIQCPNCKVGQLRYAFSAVTAHLRARCTTKGCTTVVE